MRKALGHGFHVALLWYAIGQSWSPWVIDEETIMRALIVTAVAAAEHGAHKSDDVNACALLVAKPKGNG